MTVETKDKPETKGQIAKEMGISEKQISDYRDNYILNLMQRGVLTDIDIGYFRAKGQLSASDLGIEMSKEEKEYISLGHQKLLPPEYVREMEAAESRGRYNLEKNTIPLILGRFLPVTAATLFQEQNLLYKNQLFEVRDRIVTNYDAIVDQVKSEFLYRAGTAWDRLEVKPNEAKDAWAVRYMRQLISKIPTKEVIYQSFYWTTRFSFVPLPSSIQEEALHQAELRDKQDRLHFESDDRKRQIHSMNELVLSGMRAQKEEALKQAGSFLDDTVFKLRKVVLETVQKAKITMQRNNGKLLGSTVKQLHHLIQQARALNFYNDQEVSSFTDTLEAQISKSTENRSIPKIEKIMKEMEVAMGRSVRAVETARTKDDEIARIIGTDVIKSARRVE